MTILLRWYESTSRDSGVDLFCHNVDPVKLRPMTEFVPLVKQKRMHTEEAMV